MKSLMLILWLLISSTLAYAGGIPQGCSYQSESCVEAGGTRNIEGVNVHLDCWRYERQYICQSGAVNTCQIYEQTCQKGSFSQCLVSIAGQCVSYRYEYECPKKVCDGTNLYCGKNIFCIDGNCAQKTPTQNKDFGQAASELDSVTNGMKNFVDQGSGVNVRIFSGTPMQCGQAVLHSDDCCSMSGWAHGILKCNDNEKKLASLRKKFYAIYIGNYCSHKVMGACTVHSNRFCVYTGKMARIVASYAKSQLGQSFGSAKNPDCSGFTIDEFQKLHFEKMNFTDPKWNNSDDICAANMNPDEGTPNMSAGLAGDMGVNSPSANQINDDIAKRLSQDQSIGSPYSDKNGYKDPYA